MSTMVEKTTLNGVEGYFYSNIEHELVEKLVTEHEKSKETISTLREIVTSTKEILKDVFGDAYE